MSKIDNLSSVIGQSKEKTVMGAVNTMKIHVANYINKKLS
jgi:hypothetical protein